MVQLTTAVQPFSFNSSRSRRWYFFRPFSMRTASIVPGRVPSPNWADTVLTDTGTLASQQPAGQHRHETAGARRPHVSHDSRIRCGCSRSFWCACGRVAGQFRAGARATASRMSSSWSAPSRPPENTYDHRGTRRLTRSPGGALLREYRRVLVVGINHCCMLGARYKGASNCFAKSLRPLRGRIAYVLEVESCDIREKVVGETAKRQSLRAVMRARR